MNRKGEKVNSFSKYNIRIEITRKRNQKRKIRKPFSSVTELASAAKKKGKVLFRFA